jgi:hypothetical protein
MAQIHTSVTHLAQVGDRFIIPGINLEVIERRNYPYQVEYILESRSGSTEAWLVDKPEAEQLDAERNRYESGEVYQGMR